MAFERPSFAQLVAQITADLSSFATDLREALSTVWAKTIHSLYAYIDWVNLQNTPLYCDLERLHDWAELYNSPRLQAVAATGRIQVTGNSGAIVLVDSLWRGDNGLDYRVTNAATLVDGAATATVVCTTVGSVGNIPASAALTVVDPLAGVAAEAIAWTDGITGGAEIEDLEDWRARVVDEWQVAVTRGGRAGRPEDYRAWARAAHPSITGALIQSHDYGSGTVAIRPICNDLDNRLPTQPIIDAVKTYLASPLGAPATADWFVYPPVLKGLVVTVDLASDIDTQENRNAVKTALLAMVLREATENATLFIAEIDAAIANVTTQYTLVAPTEDQTTANGELFHLQTVEFV